jgi:c-di-GMP-binding flagellar brake protein YcgR
MFQDTRPAELDALGGSDPWADFRVRHPSERLGLMRQLRDGAAPVILNAPDGATLTCSVWAVDPPQQRIHLSVDPQAPSLAALLQADEAVAVAYLDSVKLQFEIHHLLLVRGRDTVALQCALPQEIYRFQRRQAFRVRPLERHAPTANLRHPAIPEMVLSLRVVDVSAGGCALWLPDDVPALEPGTLIAQVEVRLDAQTRFAAALHIHHATALGGPGGVRLGCEWRPLPGPSERTLQRWIDQSQKRTRLLSLD